MINFEAEVVCRIDPWCYYHSLSLRCVGVVY